MSLPDALAYAQGLLDECPAKGNINKHNNVLSTWMQLCTEKKNEKKKENSVQIYFAFEMLHRNELKFSIKVPEI